LVELGQKVRAWQEARGLNDSTMLRRFAGLGSSKTWWRVLKGQVDELDLERQLANYRAVLALIECIGKDDGKKDDLYDDLSGVTQLRRGLMEVFVETGNARFILVEGDTGSGKTSAAKAMLARYGQRMLFIEQTIVMGDSPHNFLGAVLVALGHDSENMPTAPVGRWNAVVSVMGQTRVCLVVDELHHAGPKVLNTIKGLLNATPGEVLGLAMPSLWARLQRAAYEECRQLMGNRLAERIRLAPINAGDLTKFVGRRLPGLNGTLPQAVALLMQKAPGRGLLGFVRDCCKRAAEMFDGETIGIEDFSRAVNAEVESR
jgi:hypothetical protein